VLQNSEAVYWSGRANEPDMASYLIALLRAAGIPRATAWSRRRCLTRK